MKYQSINPYSGEMIKEFAFDTLPDLSNIQNSFDQWRKLTIEERGRQLQKLAGIIADRKEEYARIITAEMGKPYREAVYEITKVLTAFDYYIANAPSPA